MTPKRFAHTALLDFLHKRILELRSHKSQAEISYAAGFRNPSMLANIKNGNARLPIDRVSPLAAAHGVDPRRLLLLALEQHSEGTLARSFDAILGTVVSANELA